MTETKTNPKVENPRAEKSKAEKANPLTLETLEARARSLEALPTCQREAAARRP